MTQISATPALRYRAFISYSHRDRAWADWLHKALETYAVPKRLAGQITAAGVIPRRLVPIFRDRDELASATDLNQQVNQALEQSANLIVICSPRSAASRWVNEEVLAFKRLGRGDRVFCLIVDGEPGASELPGREGEECFAPALRHQQVADGTLGSVRSEPIAADARPGKDSKSNAKLKLIAGMLGVGFDVLKQRELQRRTRRMAAVTTLALIVMGVTTTLAIFAVIARHAAVVASHAAERRQKQAENLVDFMLGDLYDKLASAQRLDILESVDDQAMNYFQSLPTNDVTDAALGQRAKALEKIGSIRMDQGHLPAALAAYQTALALSATLADASPADLPRQLAYSEVQTFIGMAHWRQAQLDKAEQSFAAAQAILQRAERHTPNNPELQYQLATLDNNIGHVMEARGRLDDATRQYQSMLKLSRKLAATDPANGDWQVQLGMSHNNLGKMALLRGDLATAIEEYVADDAIESALAARDLKDDNQQQNMLAVRAILGRTLVLAGDMDAGMKDLQEAIAIALHMRSIDPNDAEIQGQVAFYSIQLARLQRLNGNLAASYVATEQALPVFLALVKKDPSNVRWQREQVEAQLEQAAQLRARGETDAARDQVRATFSSLHDLRSAQPDDRAILLAFVDSRLLLANLSAAGIAQTLRLDALHAMQAVASGAGDPRLLALQVEALLDMGQAAQAQPLIRQLWDGGYRDVALLAVLKRKQIAYPINTGAQQKLLAAGGGNHHDAI
ncbi:MAG: TIR domain-containing protein [Rhodanobacter sp.]